MKTRRKNQGNSRNGFIIALLCSVVLAFLFPSPGARRGVPLAQLIFGAKGNLGLILLPIMFYHPFQLLICGLLSDYFSTQNPVHHRRRGVSCWPSRIVRLTP